MYYYGGDYNPEQWPEEIWHDDVARMREANVTIVTLAVFSWSRIQPAEGEFDFGWLDRIIDLLHDNGIGVDLATATASPPPWMHEKYPEILPVTREGVTLSPGGRQHYAPSSPVYRRLAAELVTAVVERYKDHPAVQMWHLNNEYACHVHADYSDNARDAFRAWLEDRYGTVEALNAAWGTNFWSQRYTSFDQVLPPRIAPASSNPGQMLDFRRFTNDSLLECALMEKEIIRSAGATQPITTNFMGPWPAVDYAKWAPHLDVVSDDAYPDPNDPGSFRTAAFARDLMRSLKPGTPWLLMEQSSNALNWRPSNAPKAPGQMEALSAQCVGRGADGILFFQWRQSKAGSEKFHSAMLPHAGTGTRTWREIVRLGGMLDSLPTFEPGSPAQVALVFDWENWWALDNPDHPQNRLDYLEVVTRWHAALQRAHIQVDIVPPEKVGGEHRLAIAPVLYLMRDEGAAALKAFVEGGGTLLTGPFSDIVDGQDHFLAGGFIQRLGAILGITLEDFGALVPRDADEPGEREARVEGAFGDAVGELFAEEIWLDGAEAVATFSSGRRTGNPAVTRHQAGAGTAWYAATVLDDEGCDALVSHLAAEAGVEPVVAGAPATVDASRRGDVVTLINFGQDDATVAIGGTDILSGAEVDKVTLAPFEFAFVKELAQ